MTKQAENYNQIIVNQLVKKYEALYNKYTQEIGESNANSLEKFANWAKKEVPQTEESKISKNSQETLFSKGLSLIAEGKAAVLIMAGGQGKALLLTLSCLVLVWDNDNYFLKKLYLYSSQPVDWDQSTPRASTLQD